MWRAGVGGAYNAVHIGLDYGRRRRDVTLNEGEEFETDGRSPVGRSVGQSDDRGRLSSESGWFSLVALALSEISANGRMDLSIREGGDRGGRRPRSSSSERESKVSTWGSLNRLSSPHSFTSRLGRRDDGGGHEIFITFKQVPLALPREGNIRIRRRVSRQPCVAEWF